MVWYGMVWNGFKLDGVTTLHCYDVCRPSFILFIFLSKDETTTTTTTEENGDMKCSEGNTYIYVDIPGNAHEEFKVRVRQHDNIASIVRKISKKLPEEKCIGLRRNGLVLECEDAVLPHLTSNRTRFTAITTDRYVEGVRSEQKKSIGLAKKDPLRFNLPAESKINNRLPRRLMSLTEDFKKRNEEVQGESNQEDILPEEDSDTFHDAGYQSSLKILKSKMNADKKLNRSMDSLAWSLAKTELSVMRSKKPQLNRLPLQAITQDKRFEEDWDADAKEMNEITYQRKASYKQKEGPDYHEDDNGKETGEKLDRGHQKIDEYPSSQDRRRRPKNISPQDEAKNEKESFLESKRLSLPCIFHNSNYSNNNNYSMNVSNNQENSSESLLSLPSIPISEEESLAPKPLLAKKKDTAEESPSYHVLQTRVFEVESMFRMDLRSNLSLSLGDAQARIESSLAFLSRLEYYASERKQNMGLVFQDLRSQSDLNSNGRLQRTPHNSRSSRRLWSEESMAQDMQHQTKQLIELIRVKIEDTNDLHLARTALSEAKKCFQDLQALTHCSTLTPFHQVLIYLQAMDRS